MTCTHCHRPRFIRARGVCAACYSEGHGLPRGARERLRLASLIAPGEWIGAVELAERAGVSRRTIDRHLDEGLPGCRLRHSGARWEVGRADHR